MCVYINRLGHRRIRHVLYIDVLKQQARVTPTIITQTLHHDQQITENNHLTNINKDDWLNVVDALHRHFLHDKQIYLNKINVVAWWSAFLGKRTYTCATRPTALPSVQAGLHFIWEKYNLHSTVDEFSKES